MDVDLEKNGISGNPKSYGTSGDPGRNGAAGAFVMMPRRHFRGPETSTVCGARIANDMGNTHSNGLDKGKFGHRILLEHGAKLPLALANKGIHFGKPRRILLKDILDLPKLHTNVRDLAH